MSYQILYADPPWLYPARNNPATKFGRGMHRYQGLPTTRLCSFLIDHEIPVATDAALFLWGLWPCRPVHGETDLRDAYRVMEAWGFRSVGLGFLWVKLNPSGNGYKFGVGHYTKSNTEPCLLGIRGRMEVASNRVSQLIVAPLRDHSRKPAEVRDRIVELFGPLKRIELFARETTPGWDAHGDQVAIGGIDQCLI